MADLLPGALETLRDAVSDSYGEEITYVPVDGDPVTIWATVVVEQQDFAAEEMQAAIDLARVVCALDPKYTRDGDVRGGIRQPYTGDKFYRSEAVDPIIEGENEQRAFVYTHDSESSDNGVFWNATFQRQSLRVMNRSTTR